MKKFGERNCQTDAHVQKQTSAAIEAGKRQPCSSCRSKL